MKFQQDEEIARQRYETRRFENHINWQKMMQNFFNQNTH